MARCTWQNCNAEGEHDQVASDGEVWACLCKEHHAEIEGALDRLDAKALLSGWVRAMGGARAATKRMLR